MKRSVVHKCVKMSSTKRRPFCLGFNVLNASVYMFSVSSISGVQHYVLWLWMFTQIKYSFGIFAAMFYKSISSIHLCAWISNYKNWESIGYHVRIWLKSPQWWNVCNINSLTHGRCGRNLKSIIFKLIIRCRNLRYHGLWVSGVSCADIVHPGTHYV